MMDDLIAWLGQDVSDLETGTAFLVLALVLLFWGVSLVATEYRAAWRRWGGWRRLLPPTFSWWLGVVLLYLMGLCGYLGWVVLVTPETGVPRWAPFYFVSAAIAAVIAFRMWARESLH